MAGFYPKGQPVKFKKAEKGPKFWSWSQMRRWKIPRPYGFVSKDFKGNTAKRFTN